MTHKCFFVPQGPFALTLQCLNDDIAASINSVSDAYLSRCQETTGNTAFTRHDDSVLGQDANTRSGVVDSFNRIFDLYGSNYSSNNECERCEGEELLEDFGNKEFQRQHPSSKNSKD